jgi:hypothetical protein
MLNLQSFAVQEDTQYGHGLATIDTMTRTLPDMHRKVSWQYVLYVLGKTTGASSPYPEL